MPMKKQLEMYCTHCGEQKVTVRGNVVWFGGHDCKVHPVPGPQSPPRSCLVNDVIIVDNSEQVAHLRKGKTE